MYKLNNIPLSTYGITPGRVAGESIAIKGIFDMPKRIGDTFKDWGEIDGVEPFVAADELFFGGRTILFAGIILGTRVEVEAKLQQLRAAIALFTTVVRFETPYGTICGYIKEIKPVLYNGGATLTLEFREPVVGASCPIIGAGPTIYYSAEYSETAIKNDCALTHNGSAVQLTSFAGKFTSVISQAAANQLAIDWVKDYKQVYANTQGTCTLKPVTYFNAAKTATATRSNCGAGYVGSVVTYTVPAYKYSSQVSQLDADNKAQAEITAIFTVDYVNSQGSCILEPESTFEMISNITTSGFTGIRNQVFEVTNVKAGKIFGLMAYGVWKTYTAQSGDTATTVINALVTLINNTTATQWNAYNLAPLAGTNGFKPYASLQGSNRILISLNTQNQFTHRLL